MLFLRLSEYSLRLPLPLPQLTLEVRRGLPFFDPINLLLVRIAIHKAGAVLVVVWQAGGLHRAPAAMAAHDAVAVNQAVVELLIGVQIVILWAAIAVTRAVIAELPSGEPPFA